MRFRSLLLIVPLLACTNASKSAWLDDPLADFPAALSETGLYPDTRQPAETSPRAIGYEPRYPLWSNGSEKSRFLVLPDGGSVDTDAKPWELPEGSLFFKTFAFPDEAEPDALRYVETRVMRKTTERWEFAAYLWRPDRSDADLLDGMRAREVQAAGADGLLTHEVPSRRQCRSCHESARSAVLGFNALQLADQLERLHDESIFSPRAERPEDLAEDPQASWLLGYVTGNCVHCHNDFPEGENGSFDLRHQVFFENTVNRATESSASGNGIRIVPGRPGESVLFLAFAGQDNGTGIKAMPPLGVQLRDEAAIARLEQFILELEDTGPGE